MTKNQRRNWYKFCSEPLDKIEHYEEASAEGFAGWCMHHRREIKPDGTRVSAKELIDHNLYYGRPASELVFMRFGEHSALHNKGENHPFFGKRRSEETRHKIAESKKGENNPFFGKRRSAETRLKMSEAHKGKHLSEETRKKLSEARKGKHWYNNGVKCIKAKTCPEGFVPGRLKLLRKL